MVRKGILLRRSIVLSGATEVGRNKRCAVTAWFGVTHGHRLAKEQARTDGGRKWLD
jgi:hypothetical protein